MSKSVLDASALLVLLNQDPGQAMVAEAVTAGATISTVNLAEVITKLAETGMPKLVIHQVLDHLGLETTAFDEDTAYLAGLLRPITKNEGLSFGARACLATAQRLNLPALTTARHWPVESLDVEVRVVH